MNELKWRKLCIGRARVRTNVPIIIRKSEVTLFSFIEMRWRAKNKKKIKKVLAKYWKRFTPNVVKKKKKNDLSRSLCFAFDVGRTMFRNGVIIFPNINRGYEKMIDRRLTVIIGSRTHLVEYTTAFRKAFKFIPVNASYGHYSRENTIKRLLYGRYNLLCIFVELRSYFPRVQRGI